MTAPKVLFVEASPDPSFGGSKRVLVNLLSALDRNRYEPHVLFARPGIFVDAVRDLGVDVNIEPLLVPASRRGHEERQGAVDTLRQRLGVHRHDDGEVERNSMREILRGGRSYLHYLLRDRQLARRISRSVPPGVDLLHVNNPMHDQYVWRHVARSRRIPFVTHEHGIWRRPPAAFRQIGKEADAVFCLTEDRVDLIREFCGSSVRSVLLPNGVDANRFRPQRTTREVRDELRMPEGRALVITAGHIQRWKGQNLAVEAARGLAGQGVDFLWILCGRTLELEFKEELEASIRSFGLEDRVRLLGERSDLPDLFAAADVSVHTSVEPEPFGMVLVEAMVVGTAVVGPNEGAIPSILERGRAGRLYQPRRSDDLTTALEEMLGDEAYRNRIAAAGRERVMQTYTLESQVRVLEGVYHDILARTTTHPGRGTGSP